MSICDLPAEIIALLLSFLPADILPTLCLTHSCFNNVLAHDMLWRERALDCITGRSYYEDYDALLAHGPASENARYAILDKPSPYTSYHELYVKVFWKYGYMLGTFLAEKSWNGSLMIFSYNSRTGLIHGRTVAPVRKYRQPRWITGVLDIVIRPYHAYLESNTQASLEITYPPYSPGPYRVERGMAWRGTSVASFEGAETWPSSWTPVQDRVLSQQGNLDSAQLREEPSDDLLFIGSRFSRVYANATVHERRRSRAYANALTYLYRLPEPSAPAGFEKYSGLFYGDYNSHGLEMVFLYYPIPTTLCAVKVTGDINVPQGQLTWVIDNLDAPWPVADRETFWPEGGTAFRGRGQVSPQEFRNPQWLETKVVMFESDPFSDAQFNSQGKDRACIALWWLDMLHISIFYKVKSSL